MSEKMTAIEVIFDSITEVVPCPREGYGFISVDKCKACELHKDLVFLMKSPASGRDLHQILCEHPAARDVMEYVSDDGNRAHALICPRFKALVPLEDCTGCDLYKGQQVSEEPPVHQVLCGQIVGRQSAYFVTGAREVV